MSTKPNKKGRPRIPATKQSTVKSTVLKEAPMNIGIVVYNEEERLPAWLEFHKYAKIYLIDQASTDRTQEIARSYKNVNYISMERFERLGEPHYNMLYQIRPQEWLFRIDVDEFVSEPIFRKVNKKANEMLRTFDVRALMIHRKNFWDAEEIVDLYKSPDDPLGRDWQFRIALGPVLVFENVPHRHPNPLAPWAYLNEELYMEHRKSKESDRKSATMRDGMCYGPGVHRDKSVQTLISQREKGEI